MDLIALYTTVATEEEARRLARVLVERKLAACAQISEIESFYAWKGAVQNEREWRLLFKTTASRYEAVEQALRELHGYELPAVFAVPVVHVFAPYAAWVEAGSSGDAPPGERSD